MNALSAFRQKYARWIPIVFFGLGFLFDTIVLNRIDELRTLIQQAAYLILSGVFIGFELIETTRELTPPEWLQKIWSYRREILNFLLGTLLNSYTIFYFKSASSITSLFFISLLVGVLILNEFKRFGKSQARVHVGLWSLCLVSYFAELAPIVFGFLGTLPFLMGLVGSTAVFYLFYFVLRFFLRGLFVVTHLLLPFACVLIIFSSLYFARAIPPVPLSVSYLGIFHEVAHADGTYQLKYTRPAWKFWQHGDQTFFARPGDTIVCFARIFAPIRFSEKLHVVWLIYQKSKGWQVTDSMPLIVAGGREAGFRGVTQKANFEPGKWQVRIETDDEREVGRIGFDVVVDLDTQARQPRVLIQ